MKHHGKRTSNCHSVSTTYKRKANDAEYGDGLQDPGEPGLPGITVRLFDPMTNLLATTLTGTNGLYAFTGLTGGAYIVRFTPPGGYQVSPANQGTNDTLDSDGDTNGLVPPVVLTALEDNLTIDAGYFLFNNIDGSVFADLNGNGIFEPGDTNGLAGVVVQLYADADTNGVPDGTPIRSLATAPDGTYSFTNIPPGQYLVIEIDLPGYNSTADSDGGDPNRIAVPHVFGADNVANDFLDFRAARILGQVRFDTDVDGDVTDLGEPGLTNVTVFLYTDPNGDGSLADGVAIATNRTDLSGNYIFTNLTVGNYVVWEIDPTGFFSTGDLLPPNDSQIPVNVIGGLDYVDHDFLDSRNFSSGGTFCGHCFLVADAGGSAGGNDRLMRVDTNDVEIAIGAGTGTFNIEAIAMRTCVTNLTLYAANAGELGTINLVTGTYSPIGPFGAGNGAVGPIQFNDVDGLAFDPFTCQLYGTVRRNGG
ncbi:MAG: SdrD B-like domain-containing protein, partial [Verrucomicrobiota bacterium]